MQQTSQQVFYFIGAWSISTEPHLRPDLAYTWISPKYRSVLFIPLGFARTVASTIYDYDTDYVESLQRNVSSQYADGYFVQHQDSTGKIYNVSMIFSKDHTSALTVT